VTHTLAPRSGDVVGRAGRDRGIDAVPGDVIHIEFVNATADDAEYGYGRLSTGTHESWCVSGTVLLEGPNFDVPD
jgi:hypothetical protein